MIEQSKLQPSTNTTSWIINPAEMQQDLSLKNSIYFKESHQGVLQSTNRSQRWWRHRGKNPKKFLVPLSFNKPVE